MEKRHLYHVGRLMNRKDICTVQWRNPHLPHQESRIKISVFMDILVFGFYEYIGYIGDISVFINYSKFKYIFNLN